MSKGTRWWVQELAEYVGGERDAPPAGVPVGPSSWLWGLWWGLLIAVIAATCGQSSRFIYIDF